MPEEKQKPWRGPIYPVGFEFDPANRPTPRETVMIAIFYGTLAAIAYGFWCLYQWVTSLHVRAPAALVLAVVTLGLFGLRRWHRLSYGVVELVFACIVGWDSAPNDLPHIDLPNGLKAAGAIYLGIRALDNISQGLGRSEEKARPATGSESAAL